MALPAIETLCDAIPSGRFDLCVTFPGGATVCSYTEGFPPSLLNLVRSLLGQANSAMAPLSPIFDIIGAIAAVLECIQAIPDSLGPPPDPSKLAECIPNLVEKVEKLLLLLPQLSVPLMVVGLLDTLILMLDAAIAELNSVIGLLARISRARAVNAPGLLSIIDCGERTVTAQLSNIEGLFASINPLITIINTLGGLAGLAEIPSFDGGLGEDPSAAIAPLETIRDSLAGIRDAIPV
jgi:phage-related protein